MAMPPLNSRLEVYKYFLRVVRNCASPVPWLGMSRSQSTSDSHAQFRRNSRQKIDQMTPLFLCNGTCYFEYYSSKLPSAAPSAPLSSLLFPVNLVVPRQLRLPHQPYPSAGTFLRSATTRPDHGPRLEDSQSLLDGAQRSGTEGRNEVQPLSEVKKNTSFAQLRKNVFPTNSMLFSTKNGGFSSDFFWRQKPRKYVAVLLL